MLNSRLRKTYAPSYPRVTDSKLVDPYDGNLYTAAVDIHVTALYVAVRNGKVAGKSVVLCDLNKSPTGDPPAVNGAPQYLFIIRSVLTTGSKITERTIADFCRFEFDKPYLITKGTSFAALVSTEGATFSVGDLVTYSVPNGVIPSDFENGDLSFLGSGGTSSDVMTDKDINLVANSARTVEITLEYAVA